jgi:gliding motility-associated lipoprotein GldH
MRLAAITLFALLFSQCKPIDLYERTVDIPKHAWKSDFIPSFSFDVKDTSALYEVSLILRHTDAYPFNNIWLNVQIEAPDTMYVFRTEQRLGSNEQGWLGTGMNDVYEHRLRLNDALENAGVSFRRKGIYTFRLSQLMREDPLPHVLQAGIRVERKK